MNGYLRVKEDGAMSREAASVAGPFGTFQQLRLARDVLRAEGEALLGLSQRLDATFCRAVDLLFHCAGSVLVCGMGKAGLVGQKIAATLASTGTRSHFLHPAEAVHGDLGRIHRTDCVLVLSFSGETEEIVRLLPALRELRVSLVAITGRVDSQLARAATVALDLGPLEEACSLGLAPSTSTTAMLGLGDALALVLSRRRAFTPDDFARFHPAGSLGRRLARVDEVMRPLEQCRVAPESSTVRELLVRLGRPGRRTGAVMLTGGDGTLTGVFTDSDLARLLEAQRDEALDRPVTEVMTHRPTAIARGARLSEAVAILAQRKISELPVTDDGGRPLGLIDITDVVGLLPRDDAEAETARMPDQPGAAEERPPTVPFPQPPHRPVRP